MSRKMKDTFQKAAICFSAAFTVIILLVIISFIVVKGAPGINFHFLTGSYDDKTTYVTVASTLDASKVAEGEVAELGVTLQANEKGELSITRIDRSSLLKEGLNPKGVKYPAEKGDLITKAQNTDSSSLRLKIVRPGGGIIPMAVTTVYMILLSLLIAAPVSIMAAIYLIEYAKPGKMMNLIHFAIENLAGIPSIIYGLFGSLFFVKVCRFQYSILSGALTLGIILLPTLITTTEEALKAIPGTYRESSLGLGATKLQTISRVILPNALPGILVAVLLSIGRIVGESAALLLTSGTVAQIPKALWGNSASGATLTIKAYTLMKEENNLTMACAIGIILLLIIIVLNFASKMIMKKFLSKKGA